MTAPAPRLRAPLQYGSARGLLLILCSLAVLGGLAWYLRGRNTPPATHERPPQPVSIGEITRADLPLWVEAIGSATPPSLVTLRSRVDGQLMRLHFREGETVKAGQLLAEIDPRPFEAALTQARGQLARDSALLDNARSDLARYRTLWQQDSIARQQFDTQAALVRQYEGTVENDRGVLANARLQLSYTRILAPAAGRIGLRNVDPGNQIHASDTDGLATIAQMQPMDVVFTLPETRLPEVVRATGRHPLEAEAWDRDRRTRLATGTLQTIDNQIDAGTGTIRLKAAFPNADQTLFPNQFVNIRLLLGTRKDALVLPATALQRGAQGSFVYTVGADASVRAVPVHTGASDDGRVELLSGELQPGTRVVVDGADRLRDGARVEVIDRSAQPAPGTGKRGAGKRQPPAAKAG